MTLKEFQVWWNQFGLGFLIERFKDNIIESVNVFSSASYVNRMEIWIFVSFSIMLYSIFVAGNATYNTLCLLVGLSVGLSVGRFHFYF